MSKLNKNFEIQVRQYILEQKCVKVLLDENLVHTIKDAQELIEHLKIKFSSLELGFQSYNVSLPKVSEKEVISTCRDFFRLKKIYDIESAKDMISETENNKNQYDENAVLHEQNLELNQLIKNDKK